MPYSYQCRTCSLIQVLPLIDPPLKFESRLVYHQNPHPILKVEEKSVNLRTWFPSRATGKRAKSGILGSTKFRNMSNFFQICLSSFLILFIINSIVGVVQLYWILKYGTQRQLRTSAPTYPHDLCNYHHSHYDQTGENMAYSDNTCPHCGTTMDRD